MVFKLLETERIVLPVVGMDGHCLEDSGSHSTGNHLTLWASDPAGEVQAEKDFSQVREESGGLVLFPLVPWKAQCPGILSEVPEAWW